MGRIGPGTVGRGRGGYAGNGRAPACGWIPSVGTVRTAGRSRRFRVTCPVVYSTGVVPPATLQPGGHLARATGTHRCVALVPSVRVTTRRGLIIAAPQHGCGGAPDLGHPVPQRTGLHLPRPARAQVH